MVSNCVTGISLLKLLFKNLVCLGQKHEKFSFIYLENIVIDLRVIHTLE
jgi:hypothetical protein